MKEIDQNNLDTAIALGDAVCNELGICCEIRGRVIFQIYKKLEEMKPKQDTTVTQQSDEVRAE
jgi:hypothetical protein